MEKLDSVLAILVQNLMGTVTLMTNVKKVLDVDQTIAWLHLDLMHTQIAVMNQLLEMMIFAKYLVTWMKATVTPMMNAKAIYFVDQTIVHYPLSHILGFYLQLTVVNQKVIKHYLLCFENCPYN